MSFNYSNINGKPREVKDIFQLYFIKTHSMFNFNSNECYQLVFDPFIVLVHICFVSLSYMLVSISLTRKICRSKATYSSVPIYWKRPIYSTTVYSLQERVSDKKKLNIEIPEKEH